MSARWILGGALAGGLTAIGGWLAREPHDTAPESTETERVESAKEAPLLDEPGPRGSLPGSRRDRVASGAHAASARETDLGVIGYGCVVDTEGDPVQGARPLLEDEDAHVFRASAGPDGSWSLAALEPGPFELRVAVDGYLPHAERVTVPDTRGWRHDVRLRRAATIPVRFEDAEGKAHEAGPFDVRGLARFLGVVATLDAPGPRVPGVRGRVARESEAGRFDARAEDATPADLGPRYQGLLRLNVAPPVWVSAVLRDAVLESRRISGAEDELVFVIDREALEAQRGTVRVRIVERESNTPITEGAVLEHPSGGLRAQPRVEDGTLVFEGVAPGTLDLVCNPAEAERLERSVAVLAGAEVDLGTIALGRRAPFRVRLVDGAGSPATSRLVVVRPELSAGPGDLDPRMSVRVDAEGVAEVAHLAPGPTLVLAGGADGFAYVGRLVDTRRVKDVELVLPRGVEVVLRKSDAARAGVVRVLEDARGAPLLAGSWLPREVLLAPGAYVLRGIESGVDIERVEFTVTDERLVVRYGGAE